MGRLDTKVPFQGEAGGWWFSVSGQARATKVLG